MAVWIDQNTIDEIRSLIKNIRITNGDIQYWGSGKNSGINIICGGEQNEDSDGSDVYLCKITGGTTATGYTVYIYGNGYDEAATDSGTCEALPLAINSDLPIGYPVVLFSSEVYITGGND